MEIKYKKLSEICEIQIGKTPFRKKGQYWGKGNTWVTISDLTGKTISESKEEITDIAVHECGCKLIPKGTLLFSFKLSIGKMAFAEKDLYTNEAIAGLIIKNPKEVDNDYLYFALDSIEKVGGNLAAKGKTLNKKSLSRLKIPLPSSLEDQKRIASLLTKTESLIQQREASIDLADEFLKFKFLEMFGDPTNNPKGFDHGLIGDLASEVRYGTSMKASNEGKYPYLRMNNISYEGYWDFSSLKYIDLEKTDLEKYAIKKGDVVFNRTNSKELVGKTAVYDRDDIMVIAGYLIRLRVNEKANPWFIWGYLNSYHGKTTLLGLCRNIVGMANINAKELQGIKTLIPPIEIQNQFSEIVEQVKKLKIRYYESREELKELLSVLGQKVFKGKLVFKENFDFGEHIIPKGVPKKSKVDSTKKDQPKKLQVAEAYPSKKYEPVLEELISFIDRNFKDSFFTFEDLKKAILGEPWVDDFEMLKDYVFQLIRENKVRQVFADASFKAGFSEIDPDFNAVRKLEERIYLQKSIP